MKVASCVRWHSLDEIATIPRIAVMTGSEKNGPASGLSVHLGGHGHPRSDSRFYLYSCPGWLLRGLTWKVFFVFFGLDNPSVYRLARRPELE